MTTQDKRETQIYNLDHRIKSIKDPFMLFMNELLDTMKTKDGDSEFTKTFCKASLSMFSDIKKQLSTIECILDLMKEDKDKYK